MDTKHTLKRGLLSLVAVITVLFAPMGVVAQDAADPALEEIVVQGVRQSIQAARDAKYLSESISDSYFAEDIGKSSDENITDALQRVPGITVTRGGENGDSGTITVRGIEPALNDIKLNGVSLTSNTDSQAVDLSLFSADVLSRIDVIKSPSAKQEEGSLGGAVNLYTVSPLSREEDVLVFGLESRYNDLTEDYTPRGTFNVSKRLSDTVGFAASVFYDDNEVRRDVYETFVGSFADVRNGAIDAATGAPVDLSASGLPAFVRDPNGDGVDDVLALADGFQNYRIFEQDEKKIGGTATLQFQPDDVTDVRFDVTYSEQSEDFNLWENRGIQASFIPSDLADQPNGSSTVDLTTGRVTAYSSPVLPTLSQVRVQDGETKNLVLSGKVSRQFGAWDTSALLGYSSTDQDLFFETFNTRPEAGVRDAVGAAACGFEMRRGDGVTLPAFIPCARWDIEQAAGQFIESGSEFEREVDDEKLSFYVDFSREVEWGIINSIDFGAKYTDRTKERFSAEGFYSNAALGLPTPDISSLDVRTTPGGFLGGIAPAGVSSSWAYATIESMRNAVFPGGVPSDLVPRNPAEDWEVNEETYGAYFQANFALADGRVTGNVGARYANTDINTIGNSGFQFNVAFIDPGTGLPYPASIAFPGFADSKDYNEILPSLNVNIELKEDWLLRLSAARVLARPTIDSLAPGFLVTDRDAGRPPTGSGGNTQLDPFLSDQFDASLEWYFNDSGLLSVALFSKDIGSFAFASSDLRSFENPVTGEPCLVNRAAAPLADRNTASVAQFGCAEVIFSTQINGAGADIFGAEIGYTQVYDFLPGPFQYLGLNLNYTYADSDATVDPNNPSNPTNGLPFLNTSENSLNSTVFWENETVSLRLAYSYRDEALVTVRDVNSTVIRDARGILDFSANWQATDNILVSFAAVNLTDSFDRLFEVTSFPPTITGPLGEVEPAPFIRSEIGSNLGSLNDDRTYRLNHQGRSLRFGVRYSF